jgi:hypothetical protein
MFILHSLSSLLRKLVLTEPLFFVRFSFDSHARETDRNRENEQIAQEWLRPKIGEGTAIDQLRTGIWRILPHSCKQGRADTHRMNSRREEQFRLSSAGDGHKWYLQSLVIYIILKIISYVNEATPPDRIQVSLLAHIHSPHQATITRLPCWGKRGPRKGNIQRIFAWDYFSTRHTDV